MAGAAAASADWSWAGLGLRPPRDEPDAVMSRGRKDERMSHMQWVKVGGAMWVGLVGGGGGCRTPGGEVCGRPSKGGWVVFACRCPTACWGEPMNACM